MKTKQKTKKDFKWKIDGETNLSTLEYFPPL